MKRLSAFIIIVLFSYGCHSKKDGKIVPYKPSIILGKTYVAVKYGQIYSFDFYINENVYTVLVSENMYNAYEVGDTIHGYQVIPH